MDISEISVAGLSVRMMTADDRNVLHMANGGYELDSLTLWASMMSEGADVIDVGAYSGLYSIIAAKRGAKVIALEPMPAQYWRLGINVALNKVSVKRLNAAASDRNGWATLHYNQNVGLTTGASLEAGNKLHTGSIEVQAITIDGLGLTRVRAIKIDVERHELSVLRGAMQTIERCRPKLLVETLDAAMRDQVWNALPRYEVAKIMDKRNTLFLP